MGFGLVVAFTENLGDDVQSLASFQYLPRVDVVIDRDRPRSPVYVKAVFNGWYTHEPWDWLPSSVLPLFVSMHLAPHVYTILLSRSRVRDLLIRYGPVGARDLFTLGVLRSYGIPAYFSGCLTLTLDVGFKSIRGRPRHILVADLDVKKYRLEEMQGWEVLHVSQSLHKTPLEVLLNMPKPISSLAWLFATLNEAFADNWNYRAQRVLARRIDVAGRLVKALWRVAEIAAASLVVTSRLHVALPALAFDVPVVFVHENLRDPRFWGLTDFMNVYTPKRFKELVESGRLDPKEFSIPRYEHLQEMKIQLMEKIKEFIKGA